MSFHAKANVICFSFQRPQLVPNPGSPLSLETWCISDIESWLCDTSTLLRGGSCLDNGYMPNTPKTNSTFHNNVHVNIPSPSSVGPAAAESPTLYDNSPGKGFVGPPPYIQIKQEIDDGAEYQCSGVCVANGLAQTPVTIKREEPEQQAFTSESMEQLRKLAFEQAAKDVHVTSGYLGISPGMLKLILFNIFLSLF